MLTTLFTAFFALMIIKVPIAFTMGISCLIAIWSADLPLNTLVTRMFVAADSFPLMAIPFFILTGELMNATNLTDRILNLAQALVGHIRGGLAMVNILASIFFAGLSGSATADTAALGALEIPMMTRDGYSKEFSVAVTVASSTIGPIIPPSVMLVMYAVIANVSIARILIAGALPGLLMGGAMGVVVYVISLKRGYGKSGEFTLRNVWRTLKLAAVPLMMPLIIIGGILSGVFTATESGVVATVYALCIGFFVYRNLRLRDLPRILVNAAATTAIALMIIAMASIFSWLLAWEDFPATVTEFMLDLTANPTLVMLLIFGFILFLGLFVEGIPVLIVFAPIFVPVIEQYGIDKIHFGVLFVVTVLMGSITPPVGTLLYLGCSIAGTTVAKAGREVWPFVFIIVALIVVAVFVPGIVTIVPDLVFGSRNI